MTSLVSRILGLGGVIALALLALSLPRPPSEPGPEFTEPIVPAAEVSAVPSLWYCPWINSGFSRDTYLATAAVPDADVSFTHPDPRVGEPADVGELLIDGPGATVQDVADIANRGEAPGFVEFSDGPATATAIVLGETSVSGDRCAKSVPKLWHLSGLTTRQGYELILRLFNPIPDNAKATVRAASELGSEALPDLQSVDVVGKTWIDIDLGELLPFLDNLAVTIGTEEGTVIPAVIQRRDVDEASWPGTGLSTVWEFPTATLAGMTPRLSVWNPNEVAVDLEIDLFTRTTPVMAAFTATVEAGRPIEFPIGEQSSGAVGVRVRASAGVAASVVAADVPVETPEVDDSAPEEPGTRIAATVGAPSASQSWLLPGAGAAIGTDSSIWLMNTGSSPVTVTLQPLGGEGLVADKVRVEPGTIRRVRISPDGRVGGYRLDATAPISASWSMQTDNAVALFAGVAIGE